MKHIFSLGARSGKYEILLQNREKGGITVAIELNIGVDTSLKTMLKVAIRLQKFL